MRRAPATAARIAHQVAAPPPAVAPDPSGSPGPASGTELSAPLDDQLCFALFAATNAVVRAYRPLLNAVGLTYPQYVVLMALWETDDLGVADLAVRVRMPLADLEPALDRLVEAELVERHRSRINRRVSRVVLTDRGRLMEERAAVAQQEVRCQTRLSDDSVARLRGSLHDLTRTLDDHEGDLGSTSVAS